MATYEEIYGKRVKDFDSDPTLESSYEGQVWYDKSTGVLKSVVTIEAWSSGGNLAGGAAGSLNGGFGIQTAAQIAGGLRPGYSVKSEQYNGTGWSIAPNLNTARSEIGGAGTQTAGLVFGGRTPPSNASNTSEEFDGSSYSEGNNLGTAMRNMGSLGTQTAALSVGGAEPGNSAKNQLYNGTSWSEENDLNTAGQSIAGAGTSTAGIAIGMTPTNVSETWDGTSWTVIPNMNTNCGNRGGFGTSTNAIGFGGYSPPNPAKAITQTEEWDGSTWSVSPATLATARYMMASTKNTTTDAGLATGGGGAAPPFANLDSAEEYHRSINTITAGAWSSSGALNTARWGGGAMGSQTAGLFAGGKTPTAQNNSEEYDGTSWTEGNNLNTARVVMAAGGESTQTAGLCFGGTTSTAPDNSGVTNATEEYNGSSWTSVNNMNY